MGGHRQPRNCTGARQDFSKSILVIGASAEASAGELADLGFTTISCRNTEQALTLLSRRLCQVVLCDIDFPGSNAENLLAHMNHKFPHVAVVVIVNPANLRRGILAKFAGASGYLQTPVRAGEVAASVESALLTKRFEGILTMDSDDSSRHIPSVQPIHTAESVAPFLSNRP